MAIDSDTREGIMKQWDRWRSYIAKGGGGSWPRDAFEAVLDMYEEKIEGLKNIENKEKEG